MNCAGLRYMAKATGDSLPSRRTLCSPLLVAIPVLTLWLRSVSEKYNCSAKPGDSLQSCPLLDGSNIPRLLYVLGLLDLGRRCCSVCSGGTGCVGSSLYRWAQSFLAIRNVRGGATLSAALPLTAGLLCTLILFAFLYKYFDLLAVLILQLTSGAVLSILVLGHKGSSIETLTIALAALLLVALLVTRFGQPLAEGDPRATFPRLAGFRGEREKLQAEFSVARRAQEGMLPESPPEIPGYSIAASCTPSLEVGGDLYDFLQLPDGRIGIGVADVSGKGVPAALYMTLTKGLLASVGQDSSELATIVGEVNRHLHGVTRKKVFVTMALGFLNPETRSLQCIRAGHNPMVWRQTAKNITTLVSPPGLGLGITGSRIFSSQLKVEEMALAEGDAVVFYSDGITEAMNSRLEQFGEERLMNAVEKTDQLNAAATRDSILSAVREFLGGVHPQDDMTLVVLRVGDERMMVRG